MIRIGILGYGNLGRGIECAVRQNPDMQLAAVFTRRAPETVKILTEGVPVYPAAEAAAHADEVDVLVLCGGSATDLPTQTPEFAQWFHVVDSFDTHANIPVHFDEVDAAAKASGKMALISAGWDPGTDSVLRALFEAMVPRGTTFTNFGRGRSMGHSVAARAIKGVADAVSITIPVGGGRHSRLVYVVLEEGENLADVTARIKADDYFAHDPLDVRQCRDREELAFVADQSHGVLMERTGASGMTDNQILKFDMRINNPALTAQVLVSCARATTRLQAGCHTLIEVPPIAMLRGERMDIISRMV